MKMDKQFVNRQNLYYEVGFLYALQRWKKEPNISFLRIFKESFQAQGLWPTDQEFAREDVLKYVLRYIQINMAMQTVCCTNEIIKEAGLNQSAQEVKNKLREIKTKLDVDGKEKTTNALQMMKFIREAFAHNDDSIEISNWEMGTDCRVTIQSVMDKAGNRHNITFSFKDLIEFASVCSTNVLSIDESGIELDVNGVKLARVFDNGNVNPKQIANRIKQTDLKTKERVELTEQQTLAIINCFNNEFFHNEGIRSKLASPYRPDFVSRVFPYTFNPHNIILDLRIASNSLYYLTKNYRTYHEWFDSMFQTYVNDPNCTCEDMTHLYYMFLTGKFDSVLVTNIVFSIFSFESMSKLETLFASETLDINRVRNSIMHGRFYYNSKDGFDFYDGRSNSNLEYIGTISMGKITEVAQLLMHGYLDEKRSEINKTI